MEGERLAELRKDRKKSQKDLAEYLSVSRNTISNYESGAATPDDETKKKIALYFNVSLDYLMGLTREQTPIKETGSVFLYCENLPQHAKDELTSFLEYLKKRYNL